MGPGRHQDRAARRQSGAGRGLEGRQRAGDCDLVVGRLHAGEIRRGPRAGRIRRAREGFSYPRHLRHQRDRHPPSRSGATLSCRLEGRDRLHGGQPRRDDPAGGSDQRTRARYPGAGIRQGHADDVARSALPAKSGGSARAFVRRALNSAGRARHEDALHRAVPFGRPLMPGPNKLVRNHSHYGAFHAEVRDGRVVGVRPFEHDPDPSPLLNAIPDAVHSEARIGRPVVREGWLAQRPGHSAGRGREPFVPVSWERALDLVAGELDRVRRDHGHSAIMGGSQGWGSAGIFHDARGQVRRFLGAFGGFVDQASNYSFGAALTFLPHVLGSAQAVTGPLTSWSSIARHGRLVVLFGGANPKNMQVAKGGCGVHAVGGWMQELARAGVEVINVSPIRDDGPQAAGATWIPIRPNTDTAMLLALVHTLVIEQLHDEAFLSRHCVGFERVRSYLLGESDGEPKDADWAAAITGVPAETIRSLARRMAARRTMLSASWSLQRADHGEQPYWAVILLAAALGQIGLPGGGFGFGYGSAVGIAEPPLAFGPPSMEVLANPLGQAIPGARIADCLLHPGESYDYNGKRGTYPDIRVVYWAGV